MSRLPGSHLSRRCLTLALALAGLAAAPAPAAGVGEAPLAPAGASALAAEGAAGPNLSDFHQVLDSLGEWVVVARLGRAWRPAGVESDWHPYFHGSWTYTEDGWFWVTDEPWGWATYHYGRWLFDEGYGWVWVPGRVWAPAWVAWRWGAEAIGWAPLPPAGPPLVAFWTFVPASHFVGERVEDVALSPTRTPALLVKTRPTGAAPAADVAAAGRGPRSRPRASEGTRLAGS